MLKAVDPDMTVTYWVPEHPYGYHSGQCEQCTDGAPDAGCNTGILLHRLPEPDKAEFVVGFWPPREAERFQLLLDEMQRPPKQVDIIEDQDEWARRAGLSIDRIWAMVAYGVRDWDGIELHGQPFRPEFESVEIHGRTHQRLTDACVHVLWATRLLNVLALKCMQFNSLSDVEKKTFGSPSHSSSSKSSIDARSATPRIAAKRSGE